VARPAEAIVYWGRWFIWRTV